MIKTQIQIASECCDGNEGEKWINVEEVEKLKHIMYFANIPEDYMKRRAFINELFDKLLKERNDELQNL